MKTKFLLFVSLLAAGTSFAASSQPSKKDVEAQLQLVKGKCSEALYKSTKTFAEAGVLTLVSLIIDTLTHGLTGNKSQLTQSSVESSVYALENIYLRNNLPQELHTLFTLIHKMDDATKATLNAKLLAIANEYQLESPLTNSQEVEGYCHKKL